jgi:nitrite reductase (NADH) small subunit
MSAASGGRLEGARRLFVERPKTAGKRAERYSVTWIDVCALDDIAPDTGECALVGRLQIAILRVGEGDRIYAIDNFDPFSKAYVLSRGIVGDRGGQPKVASPMHKQSFSLTTGECLDDSSVRVGVYPARVRDGRIELNVEVSA